MVKTTPIPSEPPPKLVLTQAMLDYLKSAYRLSSADAPLTVTSLATARDVAPASATAMVKKLAAMGLLDHHPYGTIDLTDAGRLQALLAIRRHRLLECFLVQMMNFRIDEVHDESHRLEPAISDKFEQKMDQVLGHPKQCPHGDPIPDINGNFDADLGFPLTQLEVGKPARVQRVPGSKPELLNHLIELGIEPGVKIGVAKREPFGGSLHLTLGDRTALLSEPAAQAVYVRYPNAQS